MANQNAATQTPSLSIHPSLPRKEVRERWVMGWTPGRDNMLLVARNTASINFACTTMQASNKHHAFIHVNSWR